MELLLTVFVTLLSFAYVAVLLQYAMEFRNYETVNRTTNYQTYTTTVTVVIATRNEAHTITNLLTALAAQTFTATPFEVIIVDDYSDDHTVTVVNNFIMESALNIKILELKNISTPLQNKKAAITEGIKAASGELIVTTDADCIMGRNWLSAIVDYYETYQPDMIVSPVILEENNVFENLQVVEFLSLMAITGASIISSKPMMCNGANLAYPKSIFNQVGGFDGNSATASGDDTFLMFKIWEQNEDGIHFLKSAEALVVTNAQPTFAALLNQRIRWASKTKNYQLGHVTGVGFILVATNFLVLLLAILSCFQFGYFIMLITLLIFKLVADSALLNASNGFFRTNVITPFYIITLTAVYPIYLLLIMIFQYKGFSWKGRNFSGANQ